MREKKKKTDRSKLRIFCKIPNTSQKYEGHESHGKTEEVFHIEEDQVNMTTKHNMGF